MSKLILEATLDEKFSKALEKAQDGIEALRKLVKDPKDFVSTQRTAIEYLLEDLQKINDIINNKK